MNTQAGSLDATAVCVQHPRSALLGFSADTRSGLKIAVSKPTFLTPAEPDI